MKKVFELHQKITLFVNEYRVLEDGKTIAFAKQKRLALREKFTLFEDEAQTKVIAKSVARSVIDFGSVYDITDENDNPLAAIKKDFVKSLGTSTWLIYEPDLKKILYEVTEKNQSVAALRRVWNFIPFVGEIPFPIKFHFSIYRDEGLVGEYEKLSLFYDRYALKLNEPEIKKLDLRVWMIMAVLQDAMQSR